MPRRVGAALWLIATIVGMYWSSASASRAHAEAPSVDDAVGSFAADAPVAPLVLPRGLPRTITLETDRPKAGRAQRLGGGKPSGIVAAQPSLRSLAGAALRPVRDRSPLRLTVVRAFDPRGPPSFFG